MEEINRPQSLKEIAAERIREAIVEGRLKMGGFFVRKFSGAESPGQQDPDPGGPFTSQHGGTGQHRTPERDFCLFHGKAGDH